MVASTGSVTTPPHSGSVSSAWAQAQGPAHWSLGLIRGLSPLSLQTDVDPVHPSSLAQTPSIMGFYKQGVSMRNTVGWEGASHNYIYRPRSHTHTHTPFLRHQLETHILRPNEMRFEINHMLTLFNPTSYSNERHRVGKKRTVFSFLFFKAT